MKRGLKRFDALLARAAMASRLGRQPPEDRRPDASWWHGADAWRHGAKPPTEREFECDCASAPCARCGLVCAACDATDHADVCVGVSAERRAIRFFDEPLTRRLVVDVSGGNEDVASIVSQFVGRETYATKCHYYATTIEMPWRRRGWVSLDALRCGRRSVTRVTTSRACLQSIRRCDMAHHYRECHDEVSCGACGAATTRAALRPDAPRREAHVCPSFYTDYEVVCPADCGAAMPRSGLAAHAAVCGVRRRVMAACDPRFA